jgi:hypothetical protein
MFEICNLFVNKPTCVMCDTPLFGRKDKRFCNIKCKNKYHSELRTSRKSLASRVFSQILRNHRILSSFCTANTQSYEIAEIELLKLGFDKSCVTSVERKATHTIYKLLDFSWSRNSKGIISVYLNHFEKSISPFVYKRLELFGPTETNLPVTNFNSSV